MNMMLDRDAERFIEFFWQKWMGLGWQMVVHDTQTKREFKADLRDGIKAAIERESVSQSKI